MTIDRPGGRDLKQLTDTVLKNSPDGEPRELIEVALSIIARDAEKGDSVTAAYTNHLTSFYGQSPPNGSANLNRRFADDIRKGDMDGGERAKSAHDILQAHARARLEISNPEYLDNP